MTDICIVCTKERVCEEEMAEMGGILGIEKGEFWEWVLALGLEVEMIPVKWSELNGKEGSEEGIVVLFGIRSGIRE